MTDGNDWKPLVPPVPLTDHAAARGKYEEAYESMIQGIKQLISEQCPSANFLDDTHKAGYQVINCKNVSAVMNTTQLVDDIQTMFQVKCEINLNLLPKNGPVVEILVPRRVRYGFSEKYSAWQRAQFVAGASLVLVSVYAAYALMM